MLDVDSIINKPIEPIECDLALFFRPWTAKERHQILMTASYWTPRARTFAETVREKILANNNKWYDDQIIMWRTYQAIGDRFDIAKLDQNFVCYNFDREAPIWTCKGPVRKDNPVYLERKHGYEVAA
jgi:hypothetical protein